jgi:hypothetical protein
MKQYISEPDNLDDEPSETSTPNISKKEYIKNVHLLISTVIVVVDQFSDFVLVATLIPLGQLWFGVNYMVVDVMPALIFMWYTFQTEKSWKVLVTDF